MNRSMIKLIHADAFFDPEEVQGLFQVINNLNFVDGPYGKEIPNFQLIFPGASELFSHAIGEPLIVDERVSGVFRKPMNTQIHFESFESLDEWCFFIALERSTFNVFRHLSGADSALDEYRFNYKNLLEWDVDINIQLRPNQGVFFRPWLFHSCEDGIVQYYKLLRAKDQ